MSQSLINLLKKETLIWPSGHIFDLTSISDVPRFELATSWAFHGESPSEIERKINFKGDFAYIYLVVHALKELNLDFDIIYETLETPNKSFIVLN